MFTASLEMIFTPKILVRLLPFIFFYNYTHGQISEKKDRKLDSLHQLIKLPDTREKIEHFLDISDYYGSIDTEDLDSMRYYAQKAIAYTKLYEDTEKNKVDAIILLSYAEYYARNYEKAMPYAQEALSLSKKLEYGHGLSVSNRVIGSLLINKENYTDGLFHYNKAYELAKTYNDPKNTIIDLAIDISTEYLMIDYVDEASNLLIDATKLLDDPSVSIESKGIFYTNLGVINEINNNNDQAITYYKKSIDLHKQDYNEAFQLAPMQNIANIYTKMGQYQKAIDMYSQKLVLSSSEKTDIGSSFYGLGFNYIQLEDYLKAHEYLKKAQEYYVSINYIYREAASLQVLGDASLGLNKNIEAKTYYKKAEKRYLESIAYNKKNNIRKEEISRAYSSLSVIDSIFKNPQGSLQNYKQHIIYKDSIDNENKIKISERLEFAKETQKKNKEIASLETQNKIQQVKAEKQRYLEIGLLIFLVLVMLFLGVLFNRYRLKQRALKIIEEKNEENKLLMREIHHRVKNNLQIISSLLGSQIDKHIDNNELKVILQESQNKIDGYYSSKSL